MIDILRNTTYSYRVKVETNTDPPLYHVTTYPKYPKHSMEDANVKFGHYRFDLVPEWMVTAMTMLDMASEGGDATIPYFGTKSGGVYWLMADQVYGKEQNQE